MAIAKRGLARTRQLIHATLAAGVLDPATFDQPLALEAMQRRIHGALTELENAITLLGKARNERVAVRRTNTKRSKHHRVDVAAQSLWMHSADYTP